MTTEIRSRPTRRPVRPGAGGRPIHALAAAAVVLALVTGGTAARAEDGTRGIEAGLTVHNDVLAAVDGGIDRSVSAPGLVEPTLALDLGRLAGWEGTRAFIRALGIHGGDPGEGLEAHAAPSNLSNSVQTLRLLEAWVERAVFEERVSLRAGLQAVDTEFDVKETAAVFMNGGFGTGTELAQSGSRGPCVYPSSCLGLRVRYAPGDRTYAQVAILNGIATDPEDPGGGGVGFDPGRDGLFSIAEAGWQRPSGDAPFLRAALGLWHHSARVERLDAPGDGGTHARARPGAYVLVEGELDRDPARSDGRLTGFVRVGWADPDVHALESSAAAGLVRRGLLPWRSEDISALGVTVSLNGAPFRQAQRRAGAVVEAAEAAFELTHRLQLAPWLALQLGAQYFVHPGTRDEDDVLLIGLRCTISPGH